MATSASESRSFPGLETDPWSSEWASLEFAIPGEDHAQIRRKTNYVAVLGFVALAIIVAMALFGPLLVSHDPNRPDPSATLASPSREHLMGTDQYGRDVLSRVVHAARLDL